MADTITITGNLAADPEHKVLPGGDTVTNFRVGSTHRRFDKGTGTWIDVYTSWYQVSAYRALGDHAHSSFHRGDRVIVVGRLRVREWDNGTKKGIAVEIDADAVGHDLLWGVTSFQKRPAAAPPAPEPAPEGGAEPSSSAAALDAGGWGIPAAPAPDSELAEVPF